MRLSLDALDSQAINGTLAPGYILVGNSAILLQEARQYIKQSVQKQGFTDYRVWEIDAQLDWEKLDYANQQVDLFQPRTLIELRFQSALSESLAKQLRAYLETLIALHSPHRIVLISGQQTLFTAQKASWFQALSRTYPVISVDAPSSLQFPAWLKKRLHDEQLTITSDGLLYLARLTENNLAAAVQAIQKLKLVYGQSHEPLNCEHIQTVVDDHAQFELFELVDSALKGEASRCLHILHYLESQNTAPALVLGYLLKVLRSVIALRHGLDQQQSLPLLFKEYRIWPKQQALFKQALDRLTTSDLQRIFVLAHQVDRGIKGAEKRSSWLLLQQLVFKMTGCTLIQSDH